MDIFRTGSYKIALNPEEEGWKLWSTLINQQGQHCVYYIVTLTKQIKCDNCKIVSGQL